MEKVKIVQVDERTLEWISPTLPTRSEKAPPQYEDAVILDDSPQPQRGVNEAVVADKRQNTPTKVVADNQRRQADTVTDKMKDVGQYIVGATILVGLTGGLIYVVGIVLEVAAVALSVAVSVAKDVAIVVGIGIGVIAAIQILRHIMTTDSAPTHYKDSFDNVGTRQSNNAGQQTINININGSGSQSFNN